MDSSMSCLIAGHHGGLGLSDSSVERYVRHPRPLQAYVKGTVNDPTTFPEPNAAHGSNHWAFERGLSVALVPLVAAGFAKHGSSAILDGALALSLVVHSHIGFDCILADYVHKRKFPIAGPLATWGLRAATLATLYGLYEFNTITLTDDDEKTSERESSLLSNCEIGTARQ
ncbi:membrane anchor subunit of succinate dehydrogenase [Pseudozyma hubeiensis SY62]|uniref:Succinate dehydrogenase [ubiquinone] cytochrome b small subunit n=1 Tax=Pseudozyma hubeiensis (strain SY62) TaxID=1305764 RepID=R9NXG2_PSEHS|nr:membrane anchor subunit of succinate dehydrogenase [Pseudozyma hubeiensis SY62]GAC93271.1 membrane anchor subunit of succinate dehydrogenase [Pseudozyma hubeiensis SY62]